MGLFERFPYTNFHDLNLAWVLKMLMKFEAELENFINLNTIKYANPIQWDITTQYEANTIVINPNTGTAYISVQPVPSGVLLTNTDYWTVVFTLDILSTNKNITFRDDEGHPLATFSSDTGDWLIWNASLYRVTQPINVNEAYLEGYNLDRYTVELFIKDYITNLVNMINTIVGDLSDLNTTDKSNLVAAINEVLSSISTIVSAITGDPSNLTTVDRSNLVAAINELVTNIGDLTDLDTTDKTDLVAAINELVTNIGDLTDLDTTDKTDLVAAINEVLNNIGTITGDLNDLNTVDKSDLVAAINEVNNKTIPISFKITDRKFILIGDSYAAGHNDSDPSDPITAFYDYFVTYGQIPATNYTIIAADGYGFARTSYTFLSLLQNVTVTDPSEITDIVVCGGPNDTPDDVYPNVLSAIATFVSYCRSTYPNASVYIGMVGHNYQGSSSNYRLNRVLSLYMRGALENGAFYLNNIENVLHYSDCFQSGGHPSAEGQQLLGRCLLNALQTGYVSIWTQNQLQNTVTLDNIWNNATITTIFTSQHDNVVEIVNNQFINISLVSDITITSREYSDYIKIGHLSNTHIIGGDFQFTRWCSPICLYLTSGTNTGGIAEFYVADGDLYVRVYNTLSQTYVLHGLRICPFAATFPAKIC